MLIAEPDLMVDVYIAESVTVVSNATVNGTTGTTVSTPSLHDLQLYGVVVTILLCFIVFGGVKIINKVAPAFLIPVLFSLFCIYIGVFAAPRHNAPSECTLATVALFVILISPFPFKIELFFCRPLISEITFIWTFF